MEANNCDVTFIHQTTEVMAVEQSMLIFCHPDQYILASQKLTLYFRIVHCVNLSAKTFLQK